MKKIIFIDMDDTICDFKGAFKRDVKSDPCVRFPQSKQTFFENLTPIAGAIEAVEQLRESTVFDPYILSAPSVPNPFSYSGKRIWIEKHFGYAFCDRLILSAHKNLLTGDYLIDDYNSGKGQENFTGELIQFGTDQYPDWPTVMRYLQTL